MFAPAPLSRQSDTACNAREARSSTKLHEAPLGLGRALKHSKRRSALPMLQREGDELAARVGAFWLSKDGSLCDGQGLSCVALAEMVLNEEVCDFALGVACMALI